MSASERIRARRKALDEQGYQCFLGVYTFEHYVADARIGPIEAFRRLLDGQQLPSGAALPTCGAPH
jgi:hypothetical protein